MFIVNIKENKERKVSNVRERKENTEALALYDQTNQVSHFRGYSGGFVNSSGNFSDFLVTDQNSISLGSFLNNHAKRKVLLLAFSTTVPAGPPGEGRTVGRMRQI